MSEDTQIIQTAELVKATEVHRRIVTNAAMAQQSIFEVGAGLKEMRDGKLYKHLGYDNFEQYCHNEIGLSRKQSYRYIGIVEKLGENVSPVTQNLGMTKLSLLADLSEEERETVMESTDVEQISKRELEGKIAQMKAEKEAAEKAAQESAEQVESKERDNQKLADKINELTKQLAEINTELTEAKNQPVEVAVDEETAKENSKLKEQLEVEKLTHQQEMAKLMKSYDKLKDDNTKELKEAAQKRLEELQKLKKEYEEQLSSLKEQLENAAKPEEVAIEVPDIKEMFKVHLKCVIDAAKNMMAYLSEHPDEALKEQAKKSLHAISEQI